MTNVTTFPSIPTARDAIETLEEFVSAESETRGDNDASYDPTCADASMALQIIRDSLDGAAHVWTIAGQINREKDRRIADLIESNNALLARARRAEDRAEDKADGLAADLQSALDLINRRGDAESMAWLRANYPFTHPDGRPKIGR